MRKLILLQAGPLTWDNNLAKGAKDWAKYLANNNLFKHASNIQPGENLYLSGSNKPDEPCTAATKAFYAEVKNYDFNKPGFSGKTGHFTQVNPCYSGKTKQSEIFKVPTK